MFRRLHRYPDQVQERSACACVALAMLILAGLMAYWESMAGVVVFTAVGIPVFGGSLWLGHPGFDRLKKFLLFLT